MIWFHCASAGELEQAKPLIEILKKEYPIHKVVVSFFSPSGFSAGCHYKMADVITYLPADTRNHARLFMKIVHPELAIFVKYEFWYYHVAAAASNSIPLILVSGIFRKEQIFFRWYGSFFRKILSLFRQLFVQDEPSKQLLLDAGITKVSATGDTRFDRVAGMLEKAESMPAIQQFIGMDPCIVAGSTWKEDEAVLKDFLTDHKVQGMKLILAPHEIQPSRLSEILALFPRAILFSQLTHQGASKTNASVLVMDNFGMLSRLYSYATISYIGGGFNKSGIHNTLEAAVYGHPVFFGPHYKKFKEARDLIACGAAFSFSDIEEFKKNMQRLLHNAKELREAGTASASYVQEQKGCTVKILRYIQENRLLTN